MIRLRQARLHRAELRTRLPFRYGIVTMTKLPHVFLEGDWEINGRLATGLASENLPPKWFTKDPATTLGDEIAEMLSVIRRAAAAAESVPSASTAFAWWRALHEQMISQGRAEGRPDLLTGLGSSLVERCLLDAWCRHSELPISAAVASNRLGVDLGQLHPELSGNAPSDWLPARPLPRVRVRHTVGLGDPLTDADLEAGALPADGLPVSLEAAVRAYGLRAFKLKLSGNPAHDENRLARVFAVLDASAPDDWRFSLDGNENYPDAESFRIWWNSAASRPFLRDRLSRLLFVEQPVRRAAALTPAADWNKWPEAPPIIIDESDGAPEDLHRALELGYRGVSHKNCKGVFRGIANACLLRKRCHDAAGRSLRMSGEDLANVGPVALLQDLAVQALLGNVDVERNGHHYFAGLSAWPEDWQDELRERHPSLYGLGPLGIVTLSISSGELDLRSVNAAPFGLLPRLQGSRCFPPA